MYFLIKLALIICDLQSKIVIHIAIAREKINFY